MTVVTAKSQTSGWLGASRNNRSCAKEGQPIDSYQHTGERRFVLVIAGANGSGKTTLGERLVESSRLALFLNPDKLVETPERQDVPLTALSAAKLLIKQRDLLIERGESFGLETTLTGKSMMPFLRRAKQVGYQVRIAYCFVDSPELCMDRIDFRVSAGGHSVPEELVRRRFSVSMRRFWNVFRLIADEWTIYYNGGRAEVTVAEGRDRDCKVLDKRLFGLFEELAS